MQKIIVIEDNPVFCDYICNYLRKNGMETEKTYSVAQARKLIEAAGEDAIVLSDLRLADGNGIELLQWMRKQGKNQPFIMMTDYAEVHTAVETMKSGAEDYVPKKLLEEKYSLPYGSYKNGRNRFAEKRKTYTSVKAKHFTRYDNVSGWLPLRI